MSAHSPVAPLRVSNEAFLVSSTIERCPKTMMIRELVVNAIEAANEAADDKSVDITSVSIDGTSKLCIRNTGRGMSADELNRACDLASSLFKENSLDANFGMGAKVASLPSNKLGLRYRSCRNGVVSEVILCQRDGVYGRLRRTDGVVGHSMEVIDASETCRLEGGYSLESDWTEVVLFGNRAAQNTVNDPYDGNPRMGSDWLAKNLIIRFFRIPADVVVRLLPDATGDNMVQRLRTLGDLEAIAARTETATTPSGVAIHYRYCPTGFAYPGGLGCVVYKDEIYDPRADSRWVLDAPNYGIPFGANFCSVFVELPDDYPVRPDAYRQFLRFRGGDQRQVFLHDFGQLVTAYLPQWLKAIVRSYGPEQAKFVADVEDELCALVEELEIEPEFMPPLKLTEINTPKGSKGNRPIHERHSGTALNALALLPSRKFERPPEIIGLDTDDLIEERGLKGRAAKFYQVSHQLFVNLKYPAVLAVLGHLETEFANVRNVAQMRAVAQSVASWAVTRRVARALVYSLSKRAAGWPAEDVKRAQSAESLSLIADDWSTVLEAAHRRMELELGSDWQPVVEEFAVGPVFSANKA